MINGILIVDWETEKKRIEANPHFPPHLKKQLLRAFEYYVHDHMGPFAVTTMRTPVCTHPAHMWQCGGDSSSCIVYQTVVDGPGVNDVVDQYTTEDAARRGHSSALGECANIISRTRRA